MKINTQSIATVVLAFATLMALLSYFTSGGCQFFGGKWGQVDGPVGMGMCTTRLCYYLGNCGTWAFPSERCGNLQVGDTINKVYFELGTPTEIENTTFRWRSIKANGVDLQINNGALTYIKCDVPG